MLNDFSLRDGESLIKWSRKLEGLKKIEVFSRKKNIHRISSCLWKFGKFLGSHFLKKKKNLNYFFFSKFFFFLNFFFLKSLFEIIPDMTLNQIKKFFDYCSFDPAYQFLRKYVYKKYNGECHFCKINLKGNPHMVTKK